MADQELRARERAARASDDPAARVAAASALERAGRRDEAFAALWPGRKDPAVRAALGRYPAWTHVDGDAGRTRAIDMPIPRRVPRVRWSVRLRAHVFSLLAGPQGIVATGAETSTTVLLDPDDGSHGAASRARTIAWDGERRVEELRGALRWIDPDGGVVTTIRGVRQATVEDGLALVQREDALAARRAGARRWSRPLPAADLLRTLLLAGDLALIDDDERLVALDAETGRERFSLRAGSGPALLDARGLVTGGPREPVVAADLRGAELWRGPPGEALAMDGEAVVVGRTRDVLVLSRASGEELAQLPSVVRAGGATLARDGLLLWSNVRPHAGTPSEALRPPFLAAYSRTGEPLWAFDRDWFEGELPCAVVPYAGRVYVATVADRHAQSGASFVSHRRVLCLEPA